MIHRLEIYLDRVMKYAALPPAEASKTRHELEDHLLSRVADLEEQGGSRDDSAYRAIYEHGEPIDVGYGLRPRCPWVDVRLRGTARGIFAVGPKATGIFACGFVSTGVVSCGVVSFGVLSAGLVSFAVLFGLGGVSVGSISLGFNALGLIAAGLNSAGILCTGVNSVGIWVFNSSSAMSYFDETSVPSWLQELGFVMGWNRWETTLALTPIIALFGVLTITAVIYWMREFKRLERMSGCRSGLFAVWTRET